MASDGVTRHPAALARLLPTYIQGSAEAALRIEAQRDAARGAWGEGASAALLRAEYLPYFVHWLPGQSELASLDCRAYIRIWSCQGGEWSPVMPWERGPSRPRFDRERNLYLYPGDWDGSVAALAEAIERQLAEIGFSAPPWLDHPGPPDLIEEQLPDFRRRSKGCYRRPFLAQFPTEV